ncbi:MAG: Rieske 2Fe-2S domain-containing protein, partial [Bacteroidales bacterium]|nr:Rieske 2Fe-2S domain-containing protein [Bacteroidales bacterium]
GMLALSVICTHLGCIVRPDDSGFHCPCHASSFDKHGEVKSPPATRALDFFSMEIVNGELMIDIENPIRRKKFEKSQLTFA